MDDSARITLACLDLAGTSVADGGVVEKAFAEALATQGVVPGTEAYGRSMTRVRAARGQSKLGVFRQIFSDDDRARAANHSFERSYDSIIDRVGLTPIPGAEAAIDKLTDAGVHVCLTTGLGRATLGRVIDTLGWWKRADLLICPDDAGGRGRPHPDMILTAALRLQVEDVRHIAVCGDTASDMLSGHRAGASIIAGVLTGAHTRPQLESAGATHVLESITALPDLVLHTSTPVPSPR
ncbi:MAG: HAD family hydrolase [Actinoallomurus sp.]